MKTQLLSLVFLIIIFASCGSSKNLDYFTYPAYDSSHLFVHESYQVPVKNGDELSITVTSLKPEYALPYNLPFGKTITVDDEGYILYPQLGAMKVLGMTRNQIREALTSKLRVYLIDPVVVVDFARFKVTVLGEVARQGTIDVPGGKINILEALAQSGDITGYGRKESVVIIREKNGIREFGYVNLYSHNFFTTPYFRLQQNDIVYVRADNKPTTKQQALQRQISFGSSILASATAVVLLILNLTRR